MTPLYPPAPANVPADFTQPTRKYRTQVVLVLISLLISLALYLALVAGAAWLCYWAITAPWPARMERGYGIMRLIGIVCSGLLFLYLVKGLFKGSRQDQTLLVEITEEDQPELFAFIRQVCAETRAPFPHKVYVSHEVNAAVFYRSSFLSLILPTPKNLLIGLGLVNMLNLSEFKAVLAHEFGHFSQKSMKVGSYVYVAQRVFADIIYGRDFLDTIVHNVKHWDIRIAIFVWVFLGVLWILRKVLEGAFKVINLFNMSLSRQMEFNADRVAVSVSGSDPIVEGLMRSSFADASLRKLAEDLWSAADHHFYTRDIFHHQGLTGAWLKRQAKDPTLGERPSERGPRTEVFPAGKDKIRMPAMWATHPSNHEREQNAKDVYLPAPIDERSPWLLFRNADELRFEVTRRYYKVMHKLVLDPEFTDAARVQQFLDDEYAETTYGEQYAGFYDSRYLEIPDLNALLNRPLAATADAQAELAAVHGPELNDWVKAHHARLDEFDLLAGVQAGNLALKDNTLEFRGKAYRPAEAQKLLDQVKKELDDDLKHTGDMDARVFQAYRRLAEDLGEPSKTELVERYRFHLATQDMHRHMVQAWNDAQAALQFAQSKQELSPDEFAAVREMLAQATTKLHDTLKSAEAWRLPALRNMAAGEVLHIFLLQKPMVEALVGETIEGVWVQRLLDQLLELQDKLKRLLFKSLGGLLALQERIAAAHKERAYVGDSATA